LAGSLPILCERQRNIFVSGTGNASSCTTELTGLQKCTNSALQSLSPQWEAKKPIAALLVGGDLLAQPHNADQIVRILKADVSRRLSSDIKLFAHSNCGDYPVAIKLII
jgi:hypothetical protein